MLMTTVLALAPLLLTGTDQDSDGIIRVSTPLVQINVVVHGKSKPFSDLAEVLTKDDFALSDRGKLRPIAFFSVDSLKSSENKPESLPVNVFSNRQGGGTGITAILLDGLNTRFEDQSRARLQFEKILSSLNPTDRVAVYTLGRSLKVLCDFTGNPEQLRKFVARYHGAVNTEVATAEPEHIDNGDPFLDPFLNEVNQKFAGAANVDRAQLTMAAFLAIANHFAALPGRKNLIWLTGSLPFSLAGVSKALNNANVALYPVDARGLVGMPQELTAVGAGGRSSNARSRIPSFGATGLDTMQELAELTGGRAFYNTNDIAGAIRSAMEDSSTSYTLGFYPDPATLDGKFHTIRVDVKRAGLTVRARRGYFATPDRGGAAPLIADKFQLLLGSPLEGSSVPLTATIDRTESGLKISCSVDIRQLAMAKNGGFRNGAINLFFLQQDETGQPLDSIELPIEMHMSQALYDLYTKTGLVFKETIVPKKGLSTLRILVVDRGNASVASLIIPMARIQLGSVRE